MINAHTDPTPDTSEKKNDTTLPRSLKFGDAFTGLNNTHAQTADPDRTSPSITSAHPNTWESDYSQTSPDSDTVITSSANVPLPPRSKKSKKPILGLLAILVLVVGGVVGMYLVNQNQELRQQASSGDGSAVIATVGEEKIYQKDLDLELKYFPPMTDVNGQPVKEYLLEKIINDSRVLQEAGVKDTSLFNSPEKDYMARTKRAHEIIEQKELTILNESAHTTGVLISMWYQNQTLPNGFTIEQSRPLVKTKIDALHEQVSSGALTTNAARDQIRADEEQQRLDPSADGHAFAGFQLKDGATVLNSQELTSEIASLDVGGVTKVYDVSPTPTEKLFVFAVIKKKNNNRSSTTTVNQWLETLEQKYPANVN